MKRFFNWLADKISPEKPAPRVDLSRSGQHPAQQAKPKAPKQAVPRSQPEYVDFESSVDSSVKGKIDSVGPGKNVLRRSKFVREDEGTHESLSIVDETIDSSSDDQGGIDPYNTGQFDRSKNWDKRFRKD